MKYMFPKFSILLPDLRSGWNVGSFFRTADGLGIDHIFLTGITPYPPHREIAKTALGAENFVSWSYHLSAEKLLSELKEKNVSLVALELGKKAKLISSFHAKFPLCLIVGNEKEGISKSLLKFTDDQIFIPMKGKKESLNVSIAGAIAMWEIGKSKNTREKRKEQE